MRPGLPAKNESALICRPRGAVCVPETPSMFSPAPSSSPASLPKKRRLWPWAVALALIAAGGWYASQRGAPLPDLN